MKLMLFAAALAVALSAEELRPEKTAVVKIADPVVEKLTPLDRAQMAVADAKIALAESEYQTRLLQKNALVAQFCERVDATLAKCSIDWPSGVIAKKPQEKTK